MLEMLTGILLLGLLTALLTLLIEVAYSYIADYGENHVLINGEKDLVLEGGKPLLFALSDQKIYLPSACGGKGTCALCKVRVLEGGGPVLPTETPYLEEGEMAENIRLSCQLKLKEDLKIEIPEDLLSVKEYQAVIGNLERLSPGMRFVDFRIVSPPEGVDFAAGQYMQLQIPKYELTRQEEFRAYSIASPPYEKKQLSFIITKVEGGAVSTYVHDYLKEGDELLLRGPFGNFRLRDSEREILMIATGSGLAPIRSMLFTLARWQSRQKITLYYGEKKPEDLILYEELREFEKKLGDFTFIPILSRTTEEDEWSGEKGRVTDLISKYVADQADIDIYICGAPVMIRSCLSLFTEKGIPDERLSFDAFE